MPWNSERRTIPTSKVYFRMCYVSALAYYMVLRMMAARALSCSYIVTRYEQCG